MSTDQRTLRASLRTTSMGPSFRWVPTVAGIALRAATGWMFRGNGGYPRSYHREGFPEHEMQRVISGKADRFHNL